MRILLSNDDGYLAPGLLALINAFAGDHELTVVAPEREESASSQRITMRRPLRPRLATEKPGLRVFAVDGTPADCVKLAFDALLESPPDLVVSGINRGPNIGIDTRYSGTVAAAFEGVAMGIPSVAVSLATRDHSPQYESAAGFAREIILRLLRSQFDFQGTLVNINIPWPAPVQGMKITRLHRDMYRDNYEKRLDPHGKPYYWLVGSLPEADQEADTDRQAVKAGFISLTPLRLDQTDREKRKSLEESAGPTFTGQKK